MALLITFIAGISILVGAVIIKLFKNPETIEHLSIALALGSLFSLMAFDLVPEILESSHEMGLLIPIVFTAIGFVLLKLLDIFVPDHEDTDENHDTENAAHIGLISALAVILHNIVEGMTVYSLSLSSFEKGAIFALGISLHNIPMGMLIYSTLADSKKAKKIAVFASVTVSTLIGGILMKLIAKHLTENVISCLVAMASGMIIYIIFLELIPHVIKTKPAKISIIGIITGFLIVLLSCKLA